MSGWQLDVETDALVVPPAWQLDADADDVLAYRRRKRQELALGPRSFVETFDWPDVFLEVFDEHYGLETLGKNVNSGTVYLTTDYSGMGTSELAISMFQDILKSKYNMTMKVVNFRASDYCHRCQQILCRYPSAPVHIMFDMLDCISSEALLHLRALLEVNLARYNDKKEALGRRACHKEKVFQGRAFLRAAWDFLQGVQCSKHAPCANHDGICPLFPDKQDHDISINIGGTECIPWSTMGGCMGWLHEATIKFLIWMKEVKTARVDILGLECTRSFDEEMLKYVLSPEYSVNTAVTCPTDFGIPAHRQRKYCLASLVNTMREATNTSWGSNMEIFQRELVLDASVYFRASEQIVRERAEFLAKRRFLPSEGLEDKWSHLLTRGDQRRLQEYIARGEQEGATFLCVNLAQRVDFLKMPMDGLVPPLMQKSGMYGMHLRQSDTTDSNTHSETQRTADSSGKHVNREMMVIECLAVQGFPVMLDGEHYAVKHLPASMRSEKHLSRLGLNNNDWLSMAGNAMHVAQIGLLIVFALGSLEKRNLA